MAKKKSLGDDTPLQINEENTQDDVKQVFNIGAQVDLSFGRFTVREMPAEHLILFFLESVEAAQALISIQSENGLDLIKQLVSDEDLMNRVKGFLAQSIGLQGSPLDERFHNLKLSDLTKLLAAVKKTYDWEELRKGFTDLGLMETLTSLFPSIKESALDE